MEYLSPAEEGMIKLEVKKSRFFARLIPVSSRAEIEEKLNSVRIELKDSSHHCWAYRLMVNEGIEARSSDGGEPSGSAGKPILQSLEEKNFADALIIVSRYFGGIKLGIGGLSRAYRQAARLVIAEAKLIEKHPGKTFKIRFAYQFETGMRNNLQAKMGKIISSEYENEAIWVVSVPEGCAEDFIRSSRDICRGQIRVLPLNEDRH